MITAKFRQQWYLSNKIKLAAIVQLRQEGYPVQDEDVAHLSPARYGHINPFNPYGKYSFMLELEPDQLRPLRQG